MSDGNAGVSQWRNWYGRFWKMIAMAVLIAVGTAAHAVWREYQSISQFPVSSWNEDHTGDCAVVLTGGSNRVREGFDLLSRGSVKKLIVSGVNPQSDLREIFPLLPYFEKVKERDIVLERRSRTTYGNAQQALPLVEALQCHSVVLITSRSHMYRALKTFQAEFPKEIEIQSRSTFGSYAENSTIDLLQEALKSLFYSLWAY